MVAGKRLLHVNTSPKDEGEAAVYIQGEVHFKFVGDLKASGITEGEGVGNGYTDFSAEYEGCAVTEGYTDFGFNAGSEDNALRL